MVNNRISKIIKVLIFILIIVISDKVIGFVLYELYFNQKSGSSYSLNYSLNESTADILIFGNSRAQHHYDTRIISSGLDMSCFNAGQDGGHSILLPYAQIMIITNRYSPKIIVLEYTPEGLAYSEKAYDKLSILLPYYKYIEIRPLILLRGPYERIKLMSSIYPFNSDLINIIKFNTDYKKDRKQNYDGYIPLKKVMKTELAVNQFEDFTKSILDTNLVAAFEGIINMCKENDISLFIVNSPRFHKENKSEIHQSASSLKFHEIIKRNNVNYLDFSHDSAFIGKYEWFQDQAHLNEVGVGIFSNMVIDSISNKIGNNRKILTSKLNLK